MISEGGNPLILQTEGFCVVTIRESLSRLTERATMVGQQAVAVRSAEAALTIEYGVG